MNKNFDDLPEKRQAFIDLYLDLGDRDEAYRLAGYSVEGRAWKNKSRELFKMLSQQIEERLETRIGEGAILALKIIREIMEDKEVSPAIRLKAAQDYLTRGGRDRVKETKVTHTLESQMTDAQLEAEIRKFLGDIPEKAEKVLKEAREEQQGPLH